MDSKKTLAVTPAPHIHSQVTTPVIMGDIIIALVPALIWACYVFGMRALYLTVISCASCVLFEAAYELVLKKPLTVSDLSAVVTGMLLALCMPVTVPVWMLPAGAFVAVVIVKQLFGGIGKNILNPALTARALLLLLPGITYTTPVKDRFNGILTGSLDGLAASTPLTGLHAGKLPSDESGYTTLDLFIGNVPGAMGEISALLLIIGFIYLLFRRVVSWHIPAAFIGTVALLTLVFPRSGAAAIPFMASELFSGSLMLGALFMATDCVTSPITDTGKLIYGCLCGVFTVLFRYFLPSGEGVPYAILLMNALSYFAPRIPLKMPEKKKK